MNASKFGGLPVPALVFRKRLSWLLAPDPSVLYERMSGKGDGGCLQAPHTGGLCGWPREGDGKPFLRVQDFVVARYSCWGSAGAWGAPPEFRTRRCGSLCPWWWRGTRLKPGSARLREPRCFCPISLGIGSTGEVELAFMQSYYSGAGPSARLSFKVTSPATPCQWIFRAAV